MLDQEPRHHLLEEVVKRVLYDTDQGSKAHACEVIRRLLDPDSMDQSQEKNRYLNLFYEVFMDKLIAVFSADFGQGEQALLWYEYDCLPVNLVFIWRDHA